MPRPERLGQPKPQQLPPKGVHRSLQGIALFTAGRHRQQNRHQIKDHTPTHPWRTTHLRLKRQHCRRQGDRPLLIFQTAKRKKKRSECHPAGRARKLKSTLRSGISLSCLHRCELISIHRRRHEQTPPPPALIFKAGLLRNEHDPNTERNVFGQIYLDQIFPTPPFSGLALFGTVNSSGLSLSTRSFQRRPSQDRRSSSCGIIETLHTVQGGGGCYPVSITA